MDLKGLFWILIAGTLFVGCDKNVDPFDGTTGGSTGPDTSSSGVVQKVLLEDLTGFRCTNCPQAHAIADNLADIYGEQLIIVGIHCSLQFAFPTGDEGEPYSTDFRTEAGETYYEEFGMPGLPTGLVSRRIINNSPIIAPPDWAETVSGIITETPRASLEFENVEYNEGNRNVTFDLDMESLAELDPAQYFVTIYLTEDSIYDWQLNAGVDVENYLHRHVLRDNINGTWGELAFANGDAGQQNTLSFDYTLDEAWKEEHCELIAYIYNGDTREVLQANKVYVIEE